MSISREDITVFMPPEKIVALRKKLDRKLGRLAKKTPKDSKLVVLATEFNVEKPKSGKLEVVDVTASQPWNHDLAQSDGPGVVVPFDHTERVNPPQFSASLGERATMLCYLAESNGAQAIDGTLVADIAAVNDRVAQATLADAREEARQEQAAAEVSELMEYVRSLHQSRGGRASEVV